MVSLPAAPCCITSERRHCTPHSLYSLSRGELQLYADVSSTLPSDFKLPAGLDRLGLQNQKHSEGLQLCVNLETRTPEDAETLPCLTFRTYQQFPALL